MEMDYFERCRHFESYCRFLREERGASNVTITSYNRDLNQYFRWMNENGLEPEKVSHADVDRYVEHLLDLGKMATTVTRSLAAISSFYAFLQWKNLIAENPAKGLAPAKPKRRLPQVLTGKEITRLLKQPNQRDVKGCRDKAMLELLYATGIRASELIGLNVEDVNLRSGCIRCAHQNKERSIPMYSAAVQALRNYVERVRPQLIQSPDEHALFVNMRGSRMSRQGFWKLIKYYQGLSGIEKDITPHTLRHSFAVHLLEDGADIYSIQELMGYADISSTQIYTKVAHKKIKDIYFMSSTSSMPRQRTEPSA